MSVCWHLLVEKFPRKWQQLILIFGNNNAFHDHYDSSLIKADVWWQRIAASSSSKTDWLSWTEFLSVLSQLEPVSEDGGKLIFQPLLHLFPAYIQKLTLTFLYLHFEAIPCRALNQMLEVLLKDESHCRFDWTKMLLQLIHQRTKSDNGSVPGSSFEIGDMGRMGDISSKRNKPDCDYIFSSQNKSKFDKVTEMLRTEMLNDERQESAFGIWGVECPFDFEETSSTRISMDSSQQHATQQPSASSRLTRTSQKEGAGGDVLRADDDIMEIGEIQGEPHLSVDEPSHVTVNDTDTNLQSKALSLKEFWSSGDVNPECLVLLNHLSPSELPKLFEHIDVMKLSDAEIAVACRTLVFEPTSVSYQSSMAFASYFFLPMLSSLEKAAPRHLVATFVSFGKAFPQQTIDGTLGPVLLAPTCGASQCELVAKILKESFTEQYLINLLSLIVKQPPAPWSEHLPTVIQLIVDTKLKISESLMTDLFSSIEFNSETNASNIKYAKLLMSVITIYGNEMDKLHQKKFELIAANQKTFLKKHIQLALAKLQKDNK